MLSILWISAGGEKQQTTNLMLKLWLVWQWILLKTDILNHIQLALKLIFPFNQKQSPENLKSSPKETDPTISNSQFQAFTAFQQRYIEVSKVVDP